MAKRKEKRKNTQSKSVEKALSMHLDFLLELEDTIVEQDEEAKQLSVDYSFYNRHLKQWNEAKINKLKSRLE